MGLKQIWEKKTVCLAGWAQVLFGIKGKRWIDMPFVATHMNEYWIDPSKTEVPKEHQKIVRRVLLVR